MLSGESTMAKMTKASPRVKGAELVVRLVNEVFSNPKLVPIILPLVLIALLLLILTVLIVMAGGIQITTGDWNLYSRP
jgi:hypothetical protein